ncbi:MAG: glycosyltransferase [Flavobacteriaceae bacterium]|nr:glycosyltransferase [Flavobacteriaceae bacterium]
MNNRVVTIIPSLYDGGAEKFAADLSFGISEENELLTLIYNTTEETYPHSGKLIDLQVAETNGVLKKIKRQFSIKKKIKAFKEKNSFHVSISHMLMANMLNLLTKKNEKTICVIHGEWSIKSGKGRFIDYFIKRIYRRADMIISVSHFIKQRFDEYYSLQVPHQVIYAGIDIDAVEEQATKKLDINLPTTYIVYVAGFRPVKNHIKLLNQLEAYLKEEDISLVLLGDGPLRNAIEKEICKLGLQEKVLVLGNMSNPYPVIKKAKASVLYSSSESFSLVVVESMALGVPVIATDCGGPREILLFNNEEEVPLPFRNDFGILIENPEKTNTCNLSSEIDFLLKNKDVWENISENGKKRSKAFSIKKATEAYNHLISTIIAS